MRRTARALCLGLLLTTSGVLSCADGGDVLGPLNGDTFVLTKVQGEILPFEFTIPGRPPVTVVIRWDVIRFHGGDRWQRTQGWTRQFVGFPASEHVAETEGTVRREDGRLVLSFRCDDESLALCVRPDELSPVGSETLVMEQAALWPQAGELVFQEQELLTEEGSS